MDNDTKQSADIYNLLKWVETNRKLLVRAAAVVAILGCVIGFYIWHKGSTEAKAEDALSMLPMPSALSSAADAAPFVKLADDYPGTKAAARALLLAGGIYFDAGKYDEAKGMFDRYLAEHGDYPLANEAVLGLAACLDAEGKTNDAIARYEEILRRPTDSTTEQARMALAHLYVAQGKPDQALRHYENALGGNTGNSWEAEGRVMGLELIGKYPNLANQAQGRRQLTNFTNSQAMTPCLTKKCTAEFIGTFTLIFIGVGAIYNASNPTAGVGLLGVALAHGLAIAVMVSATGAISGGHLNPAVTFGLLIGGKISVTDTIAYWVAQLAGGTVAACLLLSIFGVEGKSIVAAGTPDLGKGISPGTGIVIEMVLTFFLVFVVYGSAVDARAPKIGGLAIGATIALDILFGGPLTGGSMNPARTFGPALASGHWNNHYVYWIGPMLGGALAGLIYGRFLIKENK